jgi:4-aminobutyrate aminotransferase/diaminobutyrate-pyruvate transaminase/4-aminobutyrate aminotransferase/(S)-3-amino-2-methylpropionate transaminase
MDPIPNSLWHFDFDPFNDALRAVGTSMFITLSGACGPVIEADRVGYGERVYFPTLVFLAVHLWRPKVADKRYELVPVEVPEVSTRFRRISGKLPVPETLDLLRTSRAVEPLAMEGQPPVVWDRAEGFQVYDAYGNKWIDFSSGVLVTNAGHGHRRIIEAIINQAKGGLIHNYCFPSEPRVRLAKRISELAPNPLKKVFLMSTGSEATECAVKLSRKHGQAIGGNQKIAIVSFVNAFHGRTLGAQEIGGIPALKDWIGHLDPYFVQVPFPDGYWCEDTSFAAFEKSLEASGVSPEHVAGVITETYQGGTVTFAPREYMQSLRSWCDMHQVVLTLDEVQAGFGRCGKWWGFEHYGIVPDLMCLGKGISSSLPVSATVGRPELMDQFPPGSMTSTHTGNPVCAAAAMASIDVVDQENLVANSARVGEVLLSELRHVFEPFGKYVGTIDGKGLVAAVQLALPGTKQPHADLAWEVVKECVYRGLLMFGPVGVGGGSLKVCPPLCITEQAVIEGVSVMGEAMAAAVSRLEEQP